MWIKIKGDEPLFEHDCDKCHFLGTYAQLVEGDQRDDVAEFKPCDLYFCDKPRIVEFIARWSSDGPDYSSNCIFDGKPLVSASQPLKLAYTLYQQWLLRQKRLEDSNLDWVAQKEGRPW